MANIAVALGQPFMPWQREVADVGCEVDPVSGLPAYREIVVTVPRQSGKTTLFLSWQIHRTQAPRWAQPQRSVFTAQSGKDARDKWLDELYPLIKKSRLHRLVAQMTRGMGNEYIRWRNQSLIRLLSTSSSSGHSKTLHQAVLDEIWHDTDDRREQGLRPAMVTIPDAQLLVCSTAGTASSVVLNRKIRIGRESVARDADRGVAYFEYSAPDGWDPEDEGSYFGFMPALCPDPPCRCGEGDGGWRHTITLDVIRSERLSMESPEYARAYGNISTPALVEQPIDPVAWAALTVGQPEPVPPSPVFFLDAAPNVTSASIGVAAMHDGKPYLELDGYRGGAEWLVGRAADLRGRYPWARFAVLGTGAAGVLLPALKDRGVEPDLFTNQDMGRACGHLQKLVSDKAVAHSGDSLFAQALSVAIKRDIGDDLWTWSRRKSGDISPLVAVTGAAWLLESDRDIVAIY